LFAGAKVGRSGCNLVAKVFSDPLSTEERWTIIR